LQRRAKDAQEEPLTGTQIALGVTPMAAPTVQPQDVYRLRREGRPLHIIDVRTPAEYEAVHAEGAHLVPLDALDPQALMSARQADEPLYLICKSGGRAAKAGERLDAAGFTNVFNIEGGTTAWPQAGLPVVRGCTKVLRLERQVRIAAGLLVLLGVLLGSLAHPGFYALSALVGAGLVFAGITDWCGMGLLLAKMPWNQSGPAKAANGVR
jgi:rhodanese-related sulfurtransferase